MRIDDTTVDELFPADALVCAEGLVQPVAGAGARWAVGAVVKDAVVMLRLRVHKLLASGVHGVIPQVGAIQPGSPASRTETEPRVGGVLGL